MVNLSTKLQMKLSESDFCFSKRMLNFFKLLELETVGDLVEIPLGRYCCFRGFKYKCKKELIRFIEIERLELLFENFEVWKSEE